jgi:hypothetical protein
VVLVVRHETIITITLSRLASSAADSAQIDASDSSRTKILPRIIFAENHLKTASNDQKTIQNWCVPSRQPKKNRKNMFFCRKNAFFYWQNYQDGFIFKCVSHPNGVQTL